MDSPPTTPKRIRLTISVPQNVHQAYRHMSEITGRPIGTEMAEWLDATLLAAVDMTERMALARNAPRQAVQQIADLTSALVSVERVRRESKAEDIGLGGQAGAQRTAGRPGSHPPSSNTGGKPPKQHMPRARPK